MNESYAEMLTKFPLFKGHTPYGAQLLLERGDVREHEPGEVLWREGDPATSVLLVLTGKVRVYVDRPDQSLTLTEAGPGTILGELGVLCNIPRSASLQAAEKVVALQWGTEAFRRILLGNAFLSEQILGQSLRTLIEKEKTLIDLLGKRESDVDAKT